MFTFLPPYTATSSHSRYADTFVSMGQEHLKEEKMKEFDGFQVTPSLMAAAKNDAIFMHDMPGNLLCAGSTNRLIHFINALYFRSSVPRY